jgi:hypothetical protein
VNPGPLNKVPAPTCVSEDSSLQLYAKRNGLSVGPWSNFKGDKEGGYAFPV